MEGLERILDRIGSDAEGEIAEHLTHAREDSHATLLRYGKLAADKKQQLLERGKLQAQELQSRSLSAGELEARKTMLSVRQELVTEVFTRALQQLSALPADDYMAFLVRQALKASTTGHEEILLNAGDRDAYGEKLTIEVNRLLDASGKSGHLTLSPEAHGFSGGLILKNGPIETHCTLEVLVKLARNTLTGDVAKILFQT